MKTIDVGIESIFALFAVLIMIGYLLEVPSALVSIGQSLKGIFRGPKPFR